MLVITTYQGNNREWHVNTPLPSFGSRDSVVHLQADGDELEAIREQFTGIPMHRGRIVTWRGEIASFIFAHLQAGYQKSREDEKIARRPLVGQDGDGAGIRRVPA